MLTAVADVSGREVSEPVPLGVTDDMKLTIEPLREVASPVLLLLSESESLSKTLLKKWLGLLLVRRNWVKCEEDDAATGAVGAPVGGERGSEGSNERVLKVGGGICWVGGSGGGCW